jgi:mannose-6-phosphate isomerase-like protein (cupin superfamily)
MRQLFVLLFLMLAPASWADEPGAVPPLSVKPLVEKRVTTLPSGDLYWRVETLSSLDQAKAAAGEYSLYTERAGKIWLFTLGPRGGATAGATKLADVGPLPPTTAKVYLLRVNEATGPRGALTPVHKHDASEAFYVLAGEQSIRTVHGTQVVKAGQPEAGHGAGMVMQVGSSGADNLQSLVLFVVDAEKPFSTPAEFPQQ